MDAGETRITPSGIAALMAAWLLVPGTARADPSLDALKATLPEKVQSALDQMSSIGHQLLAMRTYLRSVRSLDARWSWTDAEIAEYELTKAHDTAMAAVDAVIKTFEQQNPGYSLYVNRHIRSLDEQIDKWNRNESVEVAAAELETDFSTWRGENENGSLPEAQAFLSGWRPSSTVYLAAPGMSLHGQGHAFDFQISKDGAIFVGANTHIIETEWDGGGWADKLNLAVMGSGVPFSGPLEKPYEPWHYEYDPALAE
ncbi:hypothetical protein [Mesorhizobium sp. Z1-4]|uniref:hypothetical protein n=1 Tax=Mesorhizobium sp. Z1-4 TaxID=2448478 RepID=UPI000FD92A5D|nr:hypothetical protein [Mesorhizobium sp. Z1-4]